MGTTADKGAYLNNTKLLLKQKINNLGGNITSETTFREYTNQLQEVYDRLPKTEYQEGSNITLSNTLKGKLDFEDGIVGYGDTSQESTTGKNIYPSGTSTQTIGGITFTPQIDGGIKLQGTSTYSNYYVAGGESNYVDVPNLSNLAETVTLSVSGMQEGIQVYVVGQTLGAKGTSVSGSIGFTTTANDKYRLFIRVMANNTVNTTLYIQLEKGSSATSFEKYTNGASPNPSYPQDIEVVRGKNRLDDSSLVLFNSNKYISTSNFSTEGKIEIKPSSTYSLVYKKSTINDFNMWEFDSSNNKTAISSTGSDNGNYRVRLFTTLSTTKTMSFYAGSNDTYTSIEEFLQAKELMLLEGDYSSQAIPSYLPYNTIGVKARGKNVVDWNNIPYTGQNGASVTKADSEYSVTCASSQFGFAQFTQENLKLKPNTNYIFRAKIKSTSVEAGSVIRINPYMSATGYEIYSNRATSGNIAKITFTTPSTIPSNAAVGLYPYKANESAIFTDIMICEGTDDTYEPYYTPQIKQLFLGNFKPSKIGNYKDYFYRTSGKNLFDNSVERKNAYIGASGSDIGTAITYYNSSATYTYVNCAYVEAGKTYTLSWKQNTTPASTNLRVGAIVDNNNIILNTQNTWTNSSTSITFTPNVSGYLVLCTDINATNIQLELGNTATDYNPYGNGEWYFKGKIAEVILDGTGNWVVSQTNTNTIRFGNNSILVNGLAQTIIKVISNMFVVGEPSDNNDYEHIRNANLDYPTYLFVIINKTRLSEETATAFKTWLDTNKPIVYYILKNPTDTKITDTTMISQLEDIYNLMSYAGTTILEVDGDLPMIIKVRALKGN